MDTSIRYSIRDLSKTTSFTYLLAVLTLPILGQRLASYFASKGNTPLASRHSSIALYSFFQIYKLPTVMHSGTDDIINTCLYPAPVLSRSRLSLVEEMRGYERFYHTLKDDDELYKCHNMQKFKTIIFGIFLA